MNDRFFPINRSDLDEEMLTCDVPIDGIDLEWLGRQFSTLFDRAARAVNRAGYDLDDVIVERFLGCTNDAGVLVFLPIPSLTDAALLRREVAAIDPSLRRVTVLRVTVTLERWS